MLAYAGVVWMSAMAWSMGLPEAIDEPDVGCSAAQVTLTTHPARSGASDIEGAPFRSRRPESSGFSPDAIGAWQGPPPTPMQTPPLVPVGGAVGGAVGVGVGVGGEVGGAAVEVVEAAASGRLEKEGEG